MTSKVTDTNKTIEPELLGAELSEALKNNPDSTTSVEPVAPAPEVKTEETASAQSEEIITDDPDPQVPQKEFSMPEQVNLVEEVVDAYVSNPAIANSSR